MNDVRLKAYGTALAVFALDRLTKWLIESHVSFTDSFRVIPGFFDIVHSENRGVAFGLFNDGATNWSTGLLSLFALIAVLAIAALLWNGARLDRRSFVDSWRRGRQPF
jgi:signal peptidase II